MNVQVVIRRIRIAMQDQSSSGAASANSERVVQSTVNRALRNPMQLTKTHLSIGKKLGTELQALTGSPDTREELAQELLDVSASSRKHPHSLGRFLMAAATLHAHGASQTNRPR